MCHFFFLTSCFRHINEYRTTLGETYSILILNDRQQFCFTNQTNKIFGKLVLVSSVGLYWVKCWTSSAPPGLVDNLAPTSTAQSLAPLTPTVIWDRARLSLCVAYPMRYISQEVPSHSVYCKPTSVLLCFWTDWS